VSLMYALSYYCDVLYYFGCLGLIGALWESGSGLSLITALLFIACTLSYRLQRLQDGRLRYAPMLVTPVILWLAQAGAERILCIPPCIYLYFYIQNNRTVADYYYAARKFQGMLIGLSFVLFLTLSNQAESWTKGLVWMVLYFALTIFLMRMLRHEDRTVNTTRFKLMNVLSIGSVCAAGWLLSQPQATDLIKAAFMLFVDHILAPVAALLLFIIQWILIGLNYLLNMIFGDEALMLESMPQLDMGAGMQQVMGLDERHPVEVNPVARAIVIGVGVAIALTLVIVLLRLISRQTARHGSDDANEVRESLETAEAGAQRPSLIRRRGNAPDSIRAWYLKSLLWMRAHGGSVRGNMNTLQIVEENKERYAPEALDELRSLYLPVRYGGKSEVTQDEISRMKDAYGRLKG